MKLTAILFIFIVQTHGSWVGDLENAMSSLENGFQKLITDVVTDVKDTIDCTVIAVENALSLGVNDSWYRKCNGVALPKTNEYKKDEGKQPLIFIGNKQIADNLNQDISKRLENPLSDIEGKFRHKNQDPKSINAYLKTELDNISSSLDDELKRIDKDEKSTVDSVIQYINKIHSAKHTANSSSEVKEIEKILTRPLEVVIADTKQNNSNNVKINNILTRLGNESNNKNKSSIQSTLSILDQNISKEERSQTYSKGFKDLFKKNVQKKNTSEEFQYTGKHLENLPSHSLEEDVESMDRIFGGGSASSEAHKAMLEEAKNLLQESERSSSILNNLFQKVDQSGKNIFDTL